MNKLKTVTVSFQFVMSHDTDYKDEYSTAVRMLPNAFKDLADHEMEINIAEYVDGDSGYSDGCTPYGYFNGRNNTPTISEIKYYEQNSRTDLSTQT
jgi:hypothetical protein